MKTIVKACVCVAASPVLLVMVFIVTILWAFSDRTWKETADELFPF